MASDASREQFANTAQAYVRSEIHAQGDDLAALVECAARGLDGLTGRQVLDVATGAGHTALALARAGAQVTAVDLTPEMLEVAKALTERESPDQPVAFQVAAAESLPFDDETFDAVTCRIAAHHFASPESFLSEARRVLKPGGRFLLVDNIAPELPELDDAMNRIERVRDPSHVRAYTVRFWVDAVADSGLAPERLERWRRSKDFRDWVERSRTPPERVAELEAYVLGLPASFRRYFAVEAEGSAIVRLAHEAILLAARKQR